MIVSTKSLFTANTIDTFDNFDLKTMHGISKASIALSFLLIALGILSCIYFYISTMIATYLIGFLLAVGAFFFGASAFLVRNWITAIFDALVSVIYILASILTFREPVEAASVLTLTFSIIYMFVGSTRLFAAITVAKLSRAWMALNGFITLALGVILFSLWPSTSLWMIGTLVGIDMIFGGVTLLMASIKIYAYSRADGTFASDATARI